MADVPTHDELAEVAGRIDAWLAEQAVEDPMIAGVERDDADGYRWLVRVLGVEKETFAIWLHLRQRTLHYETYVMPWPEEHSAEVFELLLRRNAKIYGAAFGIGAEDAVFLAGQLDVGEICDAELDRILGTLWEWTERTFRPAMRLGFASRFSG